MDPVTTFVARQPVALFGSLTLLLTFATYFLPLPREVLPFLIVLLPSLLAIGLTAISEGEQGVRALLGKLGQWRISLKWLFIALGLALLMRLAISVFALLLGLIPTIQVRPLPPGQLLLLAVLVPAVAPTRCCNHLKSTLSRSPHKSTLSFPFGWMTHPLVDGYAIPINW